ncbi:ABC transporter ATP-binding protein [Zavarzinia sp. CC-PAN008]|uniref:ABC transporter ATP-binding protein n=1 Tax=Zavarzinia sp. CC-PAN008 TaxID=3243332 RepID=UPI003F7456F3
MSEDYVIRVRGLETRFGPAVIHQGLNLDIRRGEILGVVGGSGTGKSVLMRTIIGLVRPYAGTIEVLGQNVDELDDVALRRLESRWGVLFQSGALFTSLSVAQNVQVPMREHLDLSQGLMDQLAALKIGMVGLPPDAGPKLPSSLSGGMKKRAGLARALALDPEILFLDEPTAGLDPIGAAAFDKLILDLHRTMGITVVMITHDLDSLATICDRIAVLARKQVIAVAPMAELLDNPDPWIVEYFHGPRGRAARDAQDRTVQDRTIQDSQSQDRSAAAAGQGRE